MIHSIMDESATTSLLEALTAELQIAIHTLLIMNYKEFQYDETVNNPHRSFDWEQD